MGVDDTNSPNNVNIRYWALLANPKRYRIIDAIKDLESDLWTSGRSQINKGDRVLIWKAQGHQNNRGIVGLGEAISDIFLSDDIDNPYWIDPKGSVEKKSRVWFQYYEHPSLPMWLGESSYDEFLSSLNVARSRGGAVFRVSATEWNKLIDILGYWPGDTVDVRETKEMIRALSRSGRKYGQGFDLLAENRNVIEIYAMNIAIEYFRELKYEVKDVSSFASYDLFCKREDGNLHVEVKGTKSEGDSIILTENEVKISQQERCVLFVVSNINLKRNEEGHLKAEGGIVRIIDPWRVDEHILQPISYKCILDQEKFQVIQ